MVLTIYLRSIQNLLEHGKLVSFGIDLLEGKDISAPVTELAQSLGISNAKKLSTLVASFSTLTWYQHIHVHLYQDEVSSHIWLINPGNALRQRIILITPVVTPARCLLF